MPRMADGRDMPLPSCALIWARSAPGLRDRRQSRLTAWHGEHQRRDHEGGARASGDTRGSRRPSAAGAILPPLAPRAFLSNRTARARPTKAKPSQSEGRCQEYAQTQRSLGSERGLATPSPDGKGEIPRPFTEDHAG
jgi:hypothetical protein